MTTIYGIKNCDTMKKAFAWLDEAGVAFDFHDYKKAGLEKPKLMQWVKLLGWKTLLNTQGMTWRKLSEEDRADLTQGKAVALMLAHTSLIKRPVVECDNGQILVGFDAAVYKSFIKHG
ncbi:MAG: hypothetical protein RIR70_664 [Pseudomonadota bacterium]|jgi:Spx/MgsR family transcriptional regulator